MPQYPLRGQSRFATGRRPYSVAIGRFGWRWQARFGGGNGSSNTVSLYRNIPQQAEVLPQVSLCGQSRFATVLNPISVALGDLMGNGKPDLAVANFSQSTFRNRNTSSSESSAAGSFCCQSRFSTGLNPYSVAIGDLEWRWQPDCGANLGSATVSVLRNTGSSGSTDARFFCGQSDFANRHWPNFSSHRRFGWRWQAIWAGANYKLKHVSVFAIPVAAVNMDAGSFAAKVEFWNRHSPAFSKP